MASLKEILLLIRSNGLSNALRILQFTLMRQKLDQAYEREREKRTQLPSRQPGNLMKAELQSNGGLFSFENASLEILFLTPDLARVTWQPGILPPAYAINKEDWEEIQVKTTQTSTGWLLESPQLSILVEASGGLTFSHPDGQILRRELPPSMLGQGSESGWTAKIRPEAGQLIYGLGDQAGPFNLDGTRHELWNTDPGGSFGPGADPLYMPLPVVCVQHPGGSYLVFYENSFRGVANFSKNDGDEKVHTFQFTKGALRYYLIAGEIPHLVERFTELTGRPGLPPLWSLGYHQSRWGYKSEADIREVVAGFREHNMPISAIHLDIDYMQGFRVFSVDQERFPDLGKLAQDLDQEGIKLVPIIDPGVKKDLDYPVYSHGVEKDAFCKLPNQKIVHGLVWPGLSAYPDFTRAKTRAWWGEQYRSLLEQGIAGIWHDMNEPTSFSAWGGMALPLSTRHDLDGQGGDHLQAHNLYALQMNRAGYEALKSLRPERRPWLISRSGWVSQQRYAWKWSGDTESTWGSLRMTIANALGMGLSGQPYTGPDIGGFSGSPDAELYLRWFQMAAFLPFFRTHSALGTARREPWVYGEPFTSPIRQALNLRYRLLPYFYSLAWETSQTGIPMVRPLFWSHPQEQSLWGVDDAFLLGDSLLVAPVLEPGATVLEVSLPPGDWIDFWTHQIHHGPAKIELPVSLEKIPLLVRAGAILPMLTGQQLELALYAPQAAQSDPQLALRLYSDPGDGYGAWRLDEMKSQRTEQGISIQWSQEGEYPFPYPNIALRLHAIRAKKISLDGKSIEPVSRVIITQPFQTLDIEA